MCELWLSNLSSDFCSTESIAFELFVLQEPTLRIVSILLKYGPWRDALLAAFKKIQAARCGRLGELDVEARAELILDILIATCEAMGGVIPTAWIEHLGHNVSHCAGPVPFLTSLRVLRPAGRCGRLGVKKFLFGKQRRWKRVCRGKIERAQALQRIARYVKVADEVGDLQAPKTCQDWVESNDTVLGLLKGLGMSGVRRRLGVRKSRRKKPRRSRGTCFDIFLVFAPLHVRILASYKRYHEWFSHEHHL